MADQMDFLKEAMQKTGTDAIKSRLYPAILSILIPFMITAHYILKKQTIAVIESVNPTLKTALMLSLVTALMQASKTIGIFVENRAFRNDSDLPMTNFLLFSNQEYSRQYKVMIHRKIASDFSMKILTEKEEMNDLSEAKRTIREAVYQIQKSFSSQEIAKQLADFRITAEFWRNYLGGAIIGFVLSCMNFGFGYIRHENKTNCLFSLFLVMVYLISITPAICRKILYYSYKDYANQFYALYVSLAIKENASELSFASQGKSEESDESSINASAKDIQEPTH